MYRTRTLNLVDIIKLKKDLLWGKYYYGLFDSGKLADLILFSNYCDNKYLIELHSIDHKAREFVNKFTHDYARKHRIRYFIRELDEATQVSDIEFMNSCGFKRYNRNYCFEYHSSKHNPNEHIQPQVLCRALEKQDIAKLIDIDSSSQIIEYRDELYKSSYFFKKNFENIFVFTSSNNLDHIEGFAFKRGLGPVHTFEIVVHPRQSEIIEDCVKALAESYIHVEKCAESFRFIINENHKTKFDELREHYGLVNSTQLLILEGTPREKATKPSQGLVFNQATSTSSPYPKIPLKSTQSKT
jgi:hypothetical protein